jgi:hypothetical protein
MAAECSEMVSNDVAVDGESVWIDPDLRDRDWGPILRNSAFTTPPPPPGSLVETSQLAAVLL